MKLPLQLYKPAKYGQRPIIWTACQPFVMNDRAVLIHRPRTVALFKSLKTPHLAIGHWCGNTQTGTKKFTFLDAPPDGRIVCARCEAAAVASGLPASSEIAGKHVCIGGVVAAAHCCPTVERADEGEK